MPLPASIVTQQPDFVDDGESPRWSKRGCGRQNRGARNLHVFAQS